jgi:hypothetical protein
VSVAYSTSRLEQPPVTSIQAGAAAARDQAPDPAPSENRRVAQASNQRGKRVTKGESSWQAKRPEYLYPNGSGEWHDAPHARRLDEEDTSLGTGISDWRVALP